MNFDELYNKHHSQVRKTVAKYLRNEADIDDIVQEVFLTAYVELDSFHGNSDVSTWLTKIAMNKSIDFIRKSRITFVGDSPEETSLDNPEDELITRESMREVQRYLHDIPIVRRRTIEMRELEGKSYKDISEKLDVPVNTLKTWVKRYREKVKNLVSP